MAGTKYSLEASSRALFIKLLSVMPAEVKAAFVSAAGAVMADGNKGDVTADAGLVTINAGAVDATALADGSVTEDKQSLSDVTTNNATEERHGYLPKLSGKPSDVLHGDGTWS